MQLLFYFHKFCLKYKFFIGFFNRNSSLLSFGGPNCILEVMPITYFFVITRISLQNSSSLDFVPPTGISSTIRDQELNTDKLWRAAAPIYVNNGWFAITVIDVKLHRLDIKASGHGVNKSPSCCVCCVTDHRWPPPPWRPPPRPRETEAKK